jgi:hypothetical protein
MGLLAKSDSLQSLQPSAELAAFVRRQVKLAELYWGPERRNELRHLVVLPAAVVPVDETFQPVGPPQAMIVRDMSCPGLGVIHELPFSAGFMVVRLGLPDEEAILAARVHWSKPMGPFYYTGGKVIAKLDRFPSA